MVGEILFIIGVALMMSVLIRKNPIKEIPQRSINNESEEEMYPEISPVQKARKSLRKTVKDILEIITGIFKKSKKSVRAERVEEKPLREPLRGDTFFPQKNQDVSSDTHEHEFWKQSDHHLKKPLLEKNNNSSSAYSRAEILFASKNYPQAEKLYIQAASEEPDNHKIFNRLGAIYMEMKNYSDAIDSFKAAVDLDQGIASRHYNLAVAYMAKGDSYRAKRALSYAVELEPTNTKYRKILEDLK